MRAEFVCPACRQTISAPASLEGRAVACPKCKELVERWPAPFEVTHACPHCAAGAVLSNPWPGDAYTCPQCDRVIYLTSPPPPAQPEPIPVQLVHGERPNVRLGLILMGGGATLFLLVLLATLANQKTKDVQSAFILGLLAAVYFVPSGIALARRHANLMPILIVNSLLGWVCIGWVVALAWAFTDQKDGRGRSWW